MQPDLSGEEACEFKLILQSQKSLIDPASNPLSSIEVLEVLPPEHDWEESDLPLKSDRSKRLIVAVDCQLSGRYRIFSVFINGEKVESRDPLTSLAILHCSPLIEAVCQGIAYDYSRSNTCTPKGN